MPRIGFIGALCISIVLIGGALWFRFVHIAPYTASIASVERVESATIENISAEGSLDTGAYLPQASSTEPVTQISMANRQLLSDYFTLKSQGQASKENLVALANNYAEGYAEGAAGFQILSQKASVTQLIVVPDSEENLTTYGNTMATLRNKYKNLVAAEVEGNGGTINVDNSAFLTFMSTASKLYGESANELLLIKVPASLAENHLNLINNYLENSKAMELVGDPSTDTSHVYTALNIYARNNAQEPELLLNIQKVMQSNGIIFKSSI